MYGSLHFKYHKCHFFHLCRGFPGRLPTTRLLFRTAILPWILTHNFIRPALLKWLFKSLKAVSLDHEDVVLGKTPCCLAAFRWEMMGRLCTPCRKNSFVVLCLSKYSFDRNKKIFFFLTQSTPKASCVPNTMFSLNTQSLWSKDTTTSDVYRIVVIYVTGNLIFTAPCSRIKVVWFM
jgi:hypothetical protein